MTTPRQNPHLDPAGSSVVSGEASGIETHTEVSRELSCPTKMSIDALLQQNDHPHTVRAFTIRLSPKVKPSPIENPTVFQFVGWGVTTCANTTKESPIIRRVHTLVTAEVLDAIRAMTTGRERSQLTSRYTSAYRAWKKQSKVAASSPGASETKVQLALQEARTLLVDSLVQLLNQRARELETTLGDLRTAPDGSVSGLAGSYKLCFAEDKDATDDESIGQQVDSSDPSSLTSAPIN